MNILKGTIWVFFAVFINGYANAKDKVKIVANEEIKCHVELVGGGDLIHFAKVSQQQLIVITKVLAGKKISTALSGHLGV